MSVRALVLTAPGVNCDREAVEACRLADAATELVHINRLLRGTVRLHDFGFLVVPGGFSYGDHLGAGSMLAITLRYHLLEDLQSFVDDGRAVLGVCNGFQILARLGFLGRVSLAPNDSGRFVCRWVRLRAHSSPCIFLRGLDEIELPVAHGQGRVVTDEAGLREVMQHAPLRYHENPNGSTADIAGVCNARGNVFGLMPHPERYLTPYHHPQRLAVQSRSNGDTAGLRIFKNAVRYVQKEL